VAVAVVDLFEAVDVDEDHRQPLAGNAPGAIHLALESGEPGAAAQRSGELVDGHLRRQVAALVGERVQTVDGTTDILVAHVAQSVVGDAESGGEDAPGAGNRQPRSKVGLPIVDPAHEIGCGRGELRQGGRDRLPVHSVLRVDSIRGHRGGGRSVQLARHLYPPNDGPE
jgi:hypothetical protein